MHATLFKCVDDKRRVSYQDMPCHESATQSTIREPPPPPVDPRATDGRNAANRPRSAAHAAPAETWQRFKQALERADRTAAFQELTPPHQQRFGPVFDKLFSKPNKVEVAQLGDVESVSLQGDDLAELRISRETGEGKRGYSVQMMRDQKGKWLIDSM